VYERFLDFRVAMEKVKLRHSAQQVKIRWSLPEYAVRNTNPYWMSLGSGRAGVIGDHIEHGRTLDAERAENALLRYAIEAWRLGVDDADAISNVVMPVEP
jgi:hypothetical protein